ncbi:MAG: aminotransferase class V-fold PLP-dependent enzyme, partial [Spirochaetaceae bacterium]|nr:aminotransferase class V-fold PLP-dependent enzyme [Spirochaetaceae bacterium]
ELGRIPEVTLYGDNDDFRDRVGIIVFTVRDIDNETVSRMLAHYSAIAVRQAAFCAHPYVRRLTNVPVEYDEQGKPLHPKGLVRVSFGIYNTEKDIEYLADTVQSVIKQIRNTDAGTLFSSPKNMAIHAHKLPRDRG